MKRIKTLPDSLPPDKKKIFFSLTLCMLFMPLMLLAFPSKGVQTSCGMINDENNPEWILDKTVGNVDFYHRITDCDGKKAVFLKFNNKNNYKVSISWKEVFVTKQISEKKEGFFGQKKLVILPGETSPSDCSDKKNKVCLVGPDGVSPAYGAEIKEFYYKDISVTPAK